MHNSSEHEQLNQPGLQQDLAAARRELAVRAAENGARRTLSGLDRIGTPATPVTKITYGTLRYDSQVLTPDLMLSLGALEVDTGMILEKTSDQSDVANDEVITEVKLEDETLTIYRLGGGLSFRLDSQDPEAVAGRLIDRNSSPHINRVVSKRFEQSPAHVEIAKLQEKVADGDLSEQLVTDWFDPYQDPYGTMVFLQDADLVRTSHALRDIRHGIKPSALLETYLENQPDSRAEIKETADQKTIVWGRGAKKFLTTDKKTGKMQFGLNLKPGELYNEIANQSLESETAPFIETECAKDMLTWMEANGIMFAPEMQREMIRIGEADRYGSIYSQLSREVAKWVNNPERTNVSALFVPYDSENHGQQLLKHSEWGYYQDDEDPDYQRAHEEVAEKLANIDTSGMSAPAQVLFGLVKDVLNRDSDASDLPVTKTQISIRDGACFDVATYYVGAAGQDPMYRSPRNLKEVKVGEVPMLEKRHGNHTFMLTQETSFNGVSLPKGSLMAKAEDGNWAFLRLTPFVFDRPEDQQALGSEITKTLRNEKEALRRIGGMTINNLLLGARELT